jgi:hypothetical protein
MALAAYVDGGLEHRRREKIAAHLAGCDHCLGQVASLARLEAMPPAEDELAYVLPRAREVLAAPESYGAVWRPLAVTAAIACLVAAVGLSPWGPTSRDFDQPRPLAVARPTPAAINEPTPIASLPAPVYRSRSQEAPLPRLLAPLETSTVARDRLELRWSAIEQADAYEVRVLNEEGDVVWHERTRQTSLLAPVDAQFSAGQKYFVWIRAFLPDGRTVQSKVSSFRIEGPP